METILRLYEAKDLTQVVGLWYGTWHSSFPEIQHPQPYHVWKDRFRDRLVRRGEVWIAEIEGQIAGFIVVFKDEYQLCSNSTTAGELNQIFVDPTYQNRGIGTVLLKKAKEISPQGLRLKTLQSNTKACSFYKKHDFLPGKRSINKINGQPNIEYNWLPIDS